MGKNCKRVASFLLMLIVSISMTFLLAVSIEAQSIDVKKDVNLVVDSPGRVDVLPNNFRKTTDLTIIKDNKNLNLTGLDKLNIR